MKYRVNVSAEAKALISAQAHYIAVENSEPQNAAAWLQRVDMAIASLDEMPERCLLAPENELTSKTIHMLQVQSHLLLFSIELETKDVNILSFRAGRQSPKQALGE